MLIFELAEMIAIEAADDLITFPAAFLSYGREQQRRDNQLFVPDVDQRIAKGGIVSDGQICGQRPRCGGPNNEGRSRVPHDWKLYVNALADVVMILDFGFGEGCA